MSSCIHVFAFVPSRYISVALAGACLVLLPHPTMSVSFPKLCDCYRCISLEEGGGVWSHNHPPVPPAPHLFNNEAVRGYFQRRPGQPTHFAPSEASKLPYTPHKFPPVYMQHTALSTASFATPVTAHSSVPPYDGGLPPYYYDHDYGGLPLFEHGEITDYDMAPHAGVPPVMYASPPRSLRSMAAGFDSPPGVSSNPHVPGMSMARRHQEAKHRNHTNEDGDDVMHVSPPRSLRSMAAGFDSPPGASSYQHMPEMSMAHRCQEAKRRNHTNDDGDGVLQRQSHMTRSREFARQSMDLSGEGVRMPHDARKRDRV